MKGEYMKITLDIKQLILAKPKEDRDAYWDDGHLHIEIFQDNVEISVGDENIRIDKEDLLMLMKLL